MYIDVYIHMYFVVCVRLCTCVKVVASNVFVLLQFVGRLWPVYKFEYIPICIYIFVCVCVFVCVCWKVVADYAFGLLQCVGRLLSE